MHKNYISALVVLFFAIFPSKGWTEAWETLPPETIPVDNGQPWNTETAVDLYQGAWLFNFWATWCAPCVKELPDLQAAAKALAPDVQVALINVGESSEQIAQYAAEYPELQLVEGALVLQGMEFRNMQAWRLRGLPTTILVNHGHQVAKFEGVRPWHEPEEIAEIKGQLGLQ